MYFLDALTVLARQWLVVLIGIVFMGAAGFAVIRVVPTEYQATGQLILLLPSTPLTEDTGPINPYLNLPPELTTTASLLAGDIMTKDTQATVADEGFTSEYDVAVVPGAGPLLIITAKDTDPQEALETRDEVMARLQEDLLSIQTQVDVPERQLISARPSSVVEQAEALPGSKIRALAVVAGVGITLTLLIAFLMDRRRRRRASPAGDGDTSGAAAD